MILQNSFFSRSSVVVAKELLGKILARKIDGKTLKFEITETESYEGFEDRASHASRGKTARNSPMFEEAGTIYVYFTYGMHWMLNIVCGPKGHPSAVLVRAIERLKEGKIEKFDGPAKLTKHLKIDKYLNNRKLGRKSGLWVEDTGGKRKLEIKKLPRVGVDYSGPIWSKKLLRFKIADGKVRQKKTARQ